MHFFTFFGYGLGAYSGIAQACVRNGRFSATDSERIIKQGASLSLVDQTTAFVHGGGMSAIDATRMLTPANLS